MKAPLEGGRPHRLEHRITVLAHRHLGADSGGVPARAAARTQEVNGVRLDGVLYLGFQRLVRLFHTTLRDAYSQFGSPHPPWAAAY